MADSSIHRAFCSFIWLCYENSKLTATAVRRNSLSSLSECEPVSVTTQDTILSIRGKVGVGETAIDIRSVECQERGEHCAAS